MRQILTVLKRADGPSIRLENVAYRYPNGYVALDAVSAAFDPGDFVCVTGVSGAGKSTLLKLVYGALRVSEGRIWVDGEELTRASWRQLARMRRRFGFVFQDYALLPRLTAIENVRLPLETTSIWMAHREATRRAEEALEAVGLADRRDSFPAQLSGGQQQRLAIARAVVVRPRILMADEPTGNLDDENGRRVASLLEAIAAKGTTVLVVTHDKRLHARGHRRVTLAGGRLIEEEAVAAAPRGLA